MIRKLSDRVIDRLGPDPNGRKQYDVYDAKMALGLCYSDGGARTFFIFWKDAGGANRRISVGRYDKGMSVAQARDAAKLKLEAIRGGVEPVKGEPTLGELIERYKKHAQAHMAASSFKQVSCVLKLGISSHPELCAKKLSEVTREQLEELHGEVGRTRGKYAANHLLKVLRAMFGLARDWHMRSGDNPCRVEFFKVAGRERFLSMGELRRLNSALLAEPDWRWREFFPLLLSLGLRKSELLGLSWDRVDFEGETLRLSRTKNGKPLTLPLSDPIVSKLKKLPSYGTSQFVFPGNRADSHLVAPGYAWERIRERARLEDVRIHDLRHSFASFMINAGVGLPMISKMMNHSSLAMTQRYAHLEVEAMREALASHATLLLISSVAQETAATIEPSSAGEAPSAVTDG